MEAVPKLPLISFDLKVSAEKTQFGPKLKQYIADAYREDPESYGSELHRLECLRAAAVRPTIDSEGLSALTRYLCQLRLMQSRFPMSKGQPVAISFSWKDLYANMSCGLADIRFEMACILYNIGAMHSQLGASEPRTTPDSLKAACTHYQNAAWAFMYLRENYAQPPGVDVSAENMRLLQEICLAQAQECILDKSIQDTRKPSVVGAVATQVMLFYKSALALLGPSTGSDNIHEIIGMKLYNYWYRYLSFKKSYIGCIVCLYQGLNAEEQQKMGERLAFYQLAADKLVEARKLTKYIEPVQITQEALTFTNDVVEGKRKAAKNENEFIYHEEVPAKDLLADLKPVCLVKPLPINLNDPEVSGPDIFARLVPMGAHEASSLYSEEKAKLLRQVVSQAEAKDTELTEFMSSLQLDQLEVLDSEEKIPPEIAERCAAMNAKSDLIQSLVDSMNNLAEVITDVEHALAESKALIQDEIQKEKEFQKIMGPRPPSIVQTELSREFQKYQEAHNRTNESNQVLHKAMTLHIANLRLLAQPLEVLQSKIPSIEHIEGLDRDTMLEMRRVVSKAREMQTQREALIQQLRNDINGDDITSQLLARNTEPPEQIFKQELEKHNDKVKIIEQNLSAQENIINKLTSLYAAYGDSRRMLSEVLRKREGLINALVTSYDSYEELLGKSQKGMEFYKKLSVNINQLLSRLRSTCQVQEEERAQQLAKQGKVAIATPPPSSPSPRPSSATPSSGVGGKLKDYLPYMRNRGLARNLSQVPVDVLPPEQYYPESIYPTSVRPTPVGSEATDPTQMALTDGMANMAVSQAPYSRYNTLPNPYANPNAFATRGTVPHSHYSHPIQAEPQYTNPYYSGNKTPAMTTTDSQNPYANTNQAVPTSQYQYNAHMQNVVPVAVSNVSGYTTTVSVNQESTNFPQMSKQSPNVDYSQTFYNASYPQTSTPNMATYSHAQNLNTSIASSQAPSGYNSLNYPYTADGTQNQYAMSQPSMTPQPGTPSQLGTPQHSGMPQQQGMTHQLNMPQQQGITQQQNMPQQQGMIQQPGIPQQGMTLQLSMPQQQGMIQQPSTPQEQGMPQQLGMAQQQGMTQLPGMTPQMGIVQQPGTSHPGMPQQVMTSQPAPFSQPGITHPGIARQDSNMSNQSISSQAQDQSQVPNPYLSNQSINPYNIPQSQFSYGTYDGQGYAIYTNNESVMSSTTSVEGTMGQPYSSFTKDPNVNAAALAQLDAMDQPIKSHVTGEALSTTSFQHPYDQKNLNNVNTSDQSLLSFTNQNQQTFQHGVQNFPPNNQENYQVNYAIVEQPPSNYTPTFQNHPGYTFNNSTGTYEYSYGSQNSYTGHGSEQSNVDPQAQPQVSNWSAQGLYTSAGVCDTMQSPSEMSQSFNSQISVNSQGQFDSQSQQNSQTPLSSQGQQNPQGQLNQEYYNAPYGYQTTINQSNEVVTESLPASTNYVADANQATYMQSGFQNTTVTFSNTNDQVSVSSPIETVTEPPNFEQTKSTNQHIANNQQITSEIKQESEESKSIQPAENLVEPSTMDLLSEIDFTVDQTPLKPEIKVPQVSESIIKNVPVLPKAEIIKPVKEEVIERPAKRDLFSDAGLLNRFTAEVKALQQLADSFTERTASGLTVLDAKWKGFQDVQAKENMTRSKSVAANYGEGNVADVVPYDDSRLVLKSDPQAYINASYYKQLASWCIPIVISKKPSEDKHSVFWKAVLENKISCVVCLLSEIEMQGKSYLPTAKGHSLELDGNVRVTLDEVTCSVHWTERVLTVTDGKTAANVTHYQINVFPAKIVCTPLVLLADKVLSLTYEGRLSNQLAGAVVHCEAGAGRSAVAALLMMVMCQVRAGQVDLCDMLDAGCMSLYKHRTNVLEDTKYVADAYRAALFYVQGVLCSGTPMFNGEAVAAQSPTHAPPAPTPSIGNTKHKFSRESFEEMKQAPGLKSGDMKDPLNFLDPLWSLKKK